MRELYLANTWPQIVTKRGERLFEQNGFEISGNWLNGKNNYLEADRIILPYADFGDPILITEDTPDLWRKVTSYILFPDSLVGWDFSKNDYLFQKNLNAETIFLKSSNILSHSNFSSQLVTRTYGNRENRIVPLGIDIDSIRNSDGDKHNGLRVLWNHMWRSSKGTYEAFDIISNLAPIYPKVEFWIGQANTWAIYPGAEEFREKCEPKLKSLQDMSNVHFFDRIKDQNEYWRWLNQTDIGFSTAFHEGFGLSMMEQEASGIACIVPDVEAYPELHTGCLIVDRSKLGEGLQSLIESPNKRKYVAQSCVDIASGYDTSIWVKSLTEQIK